ncbi:tRNA-dihydrouridine(47) synthase [NAD(P)(+)] [Fasciola gigantica]|uniref:tRNA-dihydrouridine(47) synthase [NAD(P)(+)] n=1 Tax=Fasciola gigantica TaxID=46835 RepID=A0A504YGA6_FASGI|nr:tRNA-dihydrouridine(47) synthase [NAD(P)(+)] [Fasciola gigantica]
MTERTEMKLTGLFVMSLSVSWFKAFPEPPVTGTEDSNNPMTSVCPYIEKGCRYSHDIGSAQAEQAPDILGVCPVLVACGSCPAGVLCRWRGSHTLENVPSTATSGCVDAYTNNLSSEVRAKLMKNRYCFDRAEAIIKSEGRSKGAPNSESTVPPIEAPSNGAPSRPLGHVTDEDQIRVRRCEKKKIDFASKLYLAPLTTLGNLPFRRVCKRLGAEITCGEMALATQLLQGRQSEWALLRRHSSEDIFGIQICGAHVDTMTKAAQLIDENCDVDFVDVNCACPIDLIWKKGAGSGLLTHPSRLESIVRSIDQVLRKAVVTVKMRSAIKENKNFAHQLIPGVQRAGAALVTIHGRSREQRYTNLADWDYLKQCAEVARPGLFFGNGDVLTYDDYVSKKEASGVSGIMIARGALIKPWIFTEIRERRTWDISASERLDILREFTNYGLELWGSDTRGVETTRRFLLEWLSFLHRYIPYGILERAPQRINERPPPYFGRSDLETIMASESATDWIRISEMLLGPVPDGFQFTPKHKANAF